MGELLLLWNLALVTQQMYENTACKRKRVDLMTLQVSYPWWWGVFPLTLKICLPEIQLKSYNNLQCSCSILEFLLFPNQPSCPHPLYRLNLLEGFRWIEGEFSRHSWWDSSTEPWCSWHCVGWDIIMVIDVFCAKQQVLRAWLLNSPSNDYCFSVLSLY